VLWSLPLLKPVRPFFSCIRLSDLPLPFLFLPRELVSEAASHWDILPPLSFILLPPSRKPPLGSLVFFSSCGGRVVVPVCPPKGQGFSFSFFPSYPVRPSFLDEMVRSGFWRFFFRRFVRRCVYSRASLSSMELSAPEFRSPKFQ